MHVGDMRIGALPAIAIVAGGLPVSVGVGLSCKMRKSGQVAVCFFGDGATNEGAFHESLNAASIWKLPVIFACENNLYGASTHIYDMVNIKELAHRGDAYGIPWEIVDGNDVLAVREAAMRATARARAGEGPTLLELKTYRRGGHSRNDACGYRGKAEEALWRERCPILKLRGQLTAEGIATAEELDAIESDIERELDEAVAYAKASPDPLPEDALKGVFYGEV